MPSLRTNTDSILQWPIFGGRFPPNYLTDPVFELESCDEGKYSDSVAQGSRRRHSAKGYSRSRTAFFGFGPHQKSHHRCRHHMFLCSK
ncbi:hypothetical protein V1522DRAFT_414088, partial [Lipomyces starkeyi]